MRRGLSLAAMLAMGLAVTLLTPGTAAAAYREMRNNPTYYNTADCYGNVIMTYFYTDRSDVYWATYYDEYMTSAGWRPAETSRTLSDSDTTDYPMITNLTPTEVRVRANHYVTTSQGPNCAN